MEKNGGFDYDLVIVGAGVSGAAQFFAASKYTDLKKVALIEKEGGAGCVNSKPTNNSQTLHEGDIETNYNYEKAKVVKHKAYFTRSYVEQKNNPELFLNSPKMVFGAGAREYEFLSERFDEFKEVYPSLERLEWEELQKREPKMFEGRNKNEKVISLYNKNGITVNYGLLATSLVDDAVSIFEADKEREGDLFFNTKLKKISKINGGYTLILGEKRVTTKFVSFCTGAHSLYFAKKMNVEETKDVSISCIAGNFYYTPKYLNAKVYTVQNPEVPFSAVHGDPDILNPDRTRFGPTTRIVFTLERHKIKTFFEFLYTFFPIGGSLLATLRILLDRNYFSYIVMHNILFPIPYLGNYLFVREARKIIPSLKYSELSRAKGQGGVRPQIVRTKDKKPLCFGESKFATKGARFNITPSPGATTSVYNGLIDVRTIAQELRATFNEKKLASDFGKSLD